jgi:hypothetical protein
VSRLILIDGLAGSGKSTAAQHLWLHLARGGRDAAWFHEHEVAHPVFQYGEVEELLRQAPGPFEERVLAGWQAVAEKADGPEVRIIEGTFLQIPVGVMLAMNAPATRIRAMLRRIDATLRGRDASLIQLVRPDLRAALQQIGDVRGAYWLEAMTGTLAQSPYGQRHRVRNFDGLVAFYERQQAIIDSVWPHLTIRRRAIDVSAGRWQRHEAQMAAFAGIDRSPAPALTTPALLRHVGAYRSVTRKTCVITTDAKGLYIQLPASRALPLVRVAGGRFCVESLPIDIRFTYDVSRRTRRFTYESRMVNEVLSETSWVRA